uniref:Uncharacterized protein n=1 Tax=Mus musculus TaxID=10090 RepID=Q6R5F4_MOUSE|nr:unknown [Mus musculus]
MFLINYSLSNNKTVNHSPGLSDTFTSFFPFLYEDECLKIESPLFAKFPSCSLK